MLRLSSLALLCSFGCALLSGCSDSPATTSTSTGGGEGGGGAPIDGVQIYQPGDTLLGRPSEQWLEAYGNYRLYASDEECKLVGGDQLLVPGAGMAFDGALSCSMSADQALFLAPHARFCFACPEIASDPESDCDKTKEEDLRECAEKLFLTTPTFSIEVNEVEVPELVDDHRMVASFDMEHVEGEESQFFFAQDSEETGRPEVDTDCAAPWQAGNVCNAPPGPKRTTLAAFGLGMTFEPGTYSIRMVLAPAATTTTGTLTLTVE